MTIVAVAPFGSKVEVDGSDGTFGFIDQVKHPSWWDESVAPPHAGDKLHVCLLDPTREPYPRFSALQDDIDIARRLRGEAWPERLEASSVFLRQREDPRPASLARAPSGTAYGRQGRSGVAPNRVF